MNVEGLIFDVRDDAQDHAEGQAWTDERIVRWLAEAEREACARKGLLFESDLAKMCEITTEADRRSYTIDPRWVVITKAYLTAADSDRVIHLNLTSREVLDQQRPDWRTAARDPCELMVYDTRVEFGAPIDREWLLHLEGWRLPLVPLGGEDGGKTDAVPEIAAYQQNSHIVLANMDMNYKRMNDMSRVGVAGAEVFGKMASSALSGMNALAASVENQTV